MTFCRLNTFVFLPYNDSRAMIRLRKPSCSTGSSGLAPELVLLDLDELGSRLNGKDRPYLPQNLSEEV
jgi:hypothetical protein